MTLKFSKNHYDVIIIGARCAGAATAMLMARRGASVFIVERDAKVSDTLSTHALMRPAVTLLDQWGLLDQITATTPAVTSTQFHYGDEKIVVPVKPNGNAMGLYAPRRWVLDRVLGDSAVAAGAELWTGTKLVDHIKHTSGRVTGAALRLPDGAVQQVTAGIVIGADGRNSTVAAKAGARTIAHSDASSATIYTYVEGIRNKGYRWYYGDRIAAGLIPTTNGAHCLFISCAPSEFRVRIADDAFGGAMRILAT